MKRALILSGGTALGAVQVFPVEQLMAQHGLGAYSHVAGVSVGAVNGVMFAQDKLPALRTLWNQVKGTGFFMEPNLFGPPGLMTLSPLRRKLKAHVKLADVAPGLTYTSGVVDYERDTYLDLPHTGFSKNRRFRDAIVASAAQPLLNHGYKVQVAPGQRRWCWDGGVKHVVPFVPHPERFDAIDVVLCYPPLRLEQAPAHDMEDLLGIASRTFGIMITENVLINDVVRLKSWASKTTVTVYAPHRHDDEFDASKAAVQRRLTQDGPWMWSNPWTPQSFLQHFKNS